MTQRAATQLPQQSLAYHPSTNTGIWERQHISGGLKETSVQTKFRTGPSNDKYEEEADRIADQVTGAVISAPLLSQNPTEKDNLQRSQMGNTGGFDPISVAQLRHLPQARIQKVRFLSPPKSLFAGSRGEPLRHADLEFFTPRLGRDLSNIRIHHSPEVNETAAAISAHAFTYGSHIGFAGNQYQPSTPAGRKLLAHELAHTVQQNGASPTIQRNEDDDTRAEKANQPSGKGEDKLLDLLLYPLFIDIWNDIARHRVSPEILNEIRLKGPEDAALWNAALALPFAGATIPSDASFIDFLSGWAENAEELHRLAGGSNFFLDLASTFFGVNIESYLGSELFRTRLLEQHTPSLVTILLLAQGLVSTLAIMPSDAEIGDFDPRQPRQLNPHNVEQLALIRFLFNTILSKQIKAPEFFNVGPIKLKTHPVFAATSVSVGSPPEELTIEYARGAGEGQGGERLRLGLALNLPQIIRLASGDDSGNDPADLRAWQGSLWFNYESTNPTQLQKEMGLLPSSQFRTGSIFGGGGFLGLLEGGARYTTDSEAGRQLTAWFLNGGFGYNGAIGDNLQRIGFTATYTDWTEQDILAPGRAEGGKGVAGQSLRITPFTRLQFGGNELHQFSVGAALGFVTGSQEDFDVSDFRGDFSYTYMGDRAEGQFPAFKLDLSASVNRLDWWNPNSPLLTGLQARTQVDRFFLGGQVNLGAGNIPESRRLPIATGENEFQDTLVRTRVPTSVLFTAGFLLGPSIGNRP
ncbi:MAG: DUF4157 domain-containing protein [Cyanobacteria bacterium P01_H01_bin.152]